MTVTPGTMLFGGIGDPSADLRCLREERPDQCGDEDDREDEYATTHPMERYVTGVT